MKMTDKILHLGCKIHKCGIYLNREWPLVGASPDGINDTHIFEVKCPSSEKTSLNYMKNENIVGKYVIQMQTQMHFAKRKLGFFCAAAPNFESTQNVDIIPIGMG
uniref:YqaJ viral recombinase domain-containing protein n=1 Tax=Cacopsylla melanoneura TaxID=428564 RepID=A0A8D8QS98_9HEMI